MSNPKRIEELTEATNLQDNDLMFASVLNSRGSYDSKNVTLATIANYVRNGMEIVPSGSGSDNDDGSCTATHSGPCGYEMIDTSEDGEGIYNAETISEYTSSRSKNYLWNFMVGPENPESLEKTVSKDCLVWINGVPS